MTVAGRLVVFRDPLRHANRFPPSPGAHAGAQTATGARSGNRHGEPAAAAAGAGIGSFFFLIFGPDRTTNAEAMTYAREKAR